MSTAKSREECPVCGSLHHRVDPRAIARLIQLVKETSSEDTRRRVAEILSKIIANKQQYLQVFSALKPNLTDEIYQTNFNLYKESYKLMWQCAQNLTYPQVYTAWYHQVTSTHPKAPDNIPVGNTLLTQREFDGVRSRRTSDFWAGSSHEQATFGLARASPKVTFTSNEYGNLEQEWDNLITVIEYCMANHLYEPFNKFWQRVKGYTYVCGYWHERLTWSDWLLIAATEQNDLPVQAEALCDQGWTLTLMEQPEHLVDAEVLFEKSWQLKDENNLIFQLELAINRAVLSIHQQQFERARYWLNIEKNLLKQGQIEEGKYCCQLVRILYYEAQVLLKTGNFAEAKLVYQEALRQAGFIQWQQMEVYILNWLAEVAIGQNDPDEAERLLKISLPIAERKNDRRSIALHQRSFARLERLKGNFTQFQKWAAEASEGFERLGMLLDAHIYSNTGDNWRDI